MTVGASELLSTQNVAAYLHTRGLLEGGTALAVNELGGGVSNVVLAVETANRSYVVKQSLPQLRVAEEWLANRERASTEAAALKLVRHRTPDAVPEVFDADAGACALVIAAAPKSWPTWKSELLAGRIDLRVAVQLAETLAEWHLIPQAQLAAIDGQVAFEQLRVNPFYRTVMERVPAVADAVRGFMDRMLMTRRTFVHGDFSPKNVLVGPGQTWVIDFEVAHVGDPAFDLAFLISHLLLKGVHRPADRDKYRRCARTFLHTYYAITGESFAGPTDYVLGHAGCLVLARVDGKSPAEYLSEPERHIARQLGIKLVVESPGELP